MKSWLASISFLLLSANSFAQGIDTIKLNTVSIKPVKEISGQEIQEIDSLVLNNPVNQNLGNLLSKGSGVFVKSYGIGSLATVSFRGTAANHTNLLWNGLRMNAVSNGMVDFSLIPSYFVESVEVLESSQSLQSNAGGIGGAVQVNSRPINSKHNFAELNYALGSFGQRQIEAGFGLQKKKWYWSAKALKKEAQNNFSYKDKGIVGFPEQKLQNAEYNQLGINTKINLKLNNKTTLFTDLWYLKTDRKLPNVFTVIPNLEEQVDESFRYVLGLDQKTEKSQLTFRSGLFRDLLWYENKTVDIQSFGQSLGSRSALNYEYQVFSKTKWLLSANYEWNEVEQQAYSEKLHQQRAEAYTALEQKIGRSSQFKAGLRYLQIIESDKFFLPHIRFSQELGKNSKHSLALSYSQNAKYPSLNDLYYQPGGNEELLPETSTAYEFSYVMADCIKSEKYDLSSSLTFFQIELQDFIQWRPTAFGYWQAINIEAVQSRGTEFKAAFSKKQGPFTPSLQFNYTYTQSLKMSRESVNDLSYNKQLIYIPEHQYNILTHLAYKNFFLQYNLQFIGARYTSSDNIDYLPYYLLADVAIGKKVSYSSHEFGVQFHVVNLHNVDYQAIAQRPMPGRNYLLRLTYRINEKN